jgi:outer membrane protein OmpA-like peptidoglycan-associated protein
MTMPFLLRCLLSQILKIPTRSSFKNRIYSFIVLILLFLGAVWSIVNISKDCSNENYIALALIFAGLIFSSRLVHCWIPVLAAILWTLAGLASCSHGLGLCKGISVESVTNDAKTKLQNLKDKIDTTFNRDDDAEAVSNSGQNLDGWKYVSLDGAIKNPDKVFTCPQKITAGKVNYAIYMGNHSLFETAKYTLSDEAMPEMRQLGGLLKKYSDVKILIVGHSDNSPHRDGPVGNLLLSERRANTVADWLVENGYISVDRITPIGVGERYPVFNVTNDQQAIASRANRRVDIRVQCNMQVKNDK